MASVPNVLLLDDGELDDIQTMLQELGVPCARVRGAAIVEGSPAPRDLLISTPRRIGAVEEALAQTTDPPMRVMVVNEDSSALRAQLRHCGFDYLVRRPVHAEALRLLLLHCLYKGDEKRSEPRVAVGVEILVRTGLRSRRVTLADLSMRGCRLISRSQIKQNAKIRVEVPEALEIGDPITLPGRVQRSVEKKGDDDSTHFEVGIAFDTLAEDAREALEVIIEDRSRGPATLRGGVVPPTDAPTPEASAPVVGNGSGGEREPVVEHIPAAAEVEPPPAIDSAQKTEPERRAQPRAAYAHTVPAFGDRALRVLMGRDLSVGGMRIERQPEISLGDRLHLALYGAPGEEPILVWGRVVRDDESSGLGLSFDEVDEEAARRIERLVSELPPVEPLQGGEVEAMGTVLGEIVERPPRKATGSGVS